MKYPYTEVTEIRPRVRPSPPHNRVVTLLPPSLYFLFLSAHPAILFTHLLVGMTSYSDTRFGFPAIGRTAYGLVQQCKNVVASSTIISMILETSFLGRIVLAYIVFIPSLYSHFHYILPNHFPLVAFSKPRMQRMLPVFVGLTRLNNLHALKILMPRLKNQVKGWQQSRNTCFSHWCKLCGWNFVRTFLKILGPCWKHRENWKSWILIE